MQVQFTAQGGVKLLAAFQLLLQSLVLPVEALQTAGSAPVKGHAFYLSSTYKRNRSSYPIGGVSLA